MEQSAGFDEAQRLVQRHRGMAAKPLSGMPVPHNILSVHGHDAPPPRG
jgi:hypothetical protein